MDKFERGEKVIEGQNDRCAEEATLQHEQVDGR